MHYTGRVLLCCFLTIITPAFADTENKSEEQFGSEQEINSSKGNESMSASESGPPDSNEAMYNREINSKTRDKRSFEFLMGLVNNNSRFEVTKIDTSRDSSLLTAHQDKRVLNSSESELLLELLVKIAAHPKRWQRIHNILDKIDTDLVASKRLIEDLQTATIQSDTNKISPPINNNKKQSERRIKLNKTNHLTSNQWPMFGQDLDASNKEDFINSPPPDQRRLQAIQHKTFPKTFAYHRVTGRPLYVNKNPKAYIAVSVIAPKPIKPRSKEDEALEKELRQLKPWTHKDNLKNMASIRSRWFIQAADETNKASP